jgi:hypothetical protein
VLLDELAEAEHVGAQLQQLHPQLGVEFVEDLLVWSVGRPSTLSSMLCRSAIFSLSLVP